MRQPNDQVFARYEEYSNTVRKEPENYCLIDFNEDNIPSFNIDAATIPYREFVEIAWDIWVTSKSTSKETLAAFVSVVLKDYKPWVKMVK